MNNESRVISSDKEDEFSLAGLPPFTDIERLVIQDMCDLRKDIVDGPYSEFLNVLLSYGQEVFQARGLRGSNLSPLDAINNQRFIPPIMLADYGPIWLSKDGDIWNDFEARSLATLRGIKQFDEFVMVCGV